MDQRKILIRKLWRRDLHKVFWGNLVERPIRAIPLGRAWYDYRAGKLQDKTYLELEKHYFGLYGHTPLDDDWAGYSAHLFHTSLKQRPNQKSRAKDVRIFMIHYGTGGGPYFEGEVARSFDAVSFDMVRHQKGFDLDEDDLVSYSLGLEPAGRNRFHGPIRSSWHEWRQRFQLDVLKAVNQVHRQKPIDLCFAYGSYQEFAPETLNKIRSLGIPVALLCLDDKHAFWQRSFIDIPNGQQPLIGACDVHLTNSFNVMRWYLAGNTAAYYFPQAADTEIYKPEGINKDIEIAFIGQKYGFRANLVRNLNDQGISVDCWGKGWNNGWAYDALSLYQRSKIVLGIGYTGKSKRATCIKGKDFEIAATGAVYLTTYNAELAKHFRIGEEILCYLNEVDCAEQIRCLLDNPALCERISASARQRCLSEHTWTHRFRGLLEWMEILTCKTTVRNDYANIKF